MNEETILKRYVRLMYVSAGALIGLTICYKSIGWKVIFGIIALILLLYANKKCR